MSKIAVIYSTVASEKVMEDAYSRILDRLRYPDHDGNARVSFKKIHNVGADNVHEILESVVDLRGDFDAVVVMAEFDEIAGISEELAEKIKEGKPVVVMEGDDAELSVSVASSAADLDRINILVNLFSIGVSGLGSVGVYSSHGLIAAGDAGHNGDYEIPQYIPKSGVFMARTDVYGAALDVPLSSRTDQGRDFVSRADKPFVG
jgi:hypothetical protein